MRVTLWCVSVGSEGSVMVARGRQGVGKGVTWSARVVRGRRGCHVVGEGSEVSARVSCGR